MLDGGEVRLYTTIRYLPHGHFTLEIEGS